MEEACESRSISFVPQNFHFWSWNYGYIYKLETCLILGPSSFDIETSKKYYWNVEKSGKKLVVENGKGCSNIIKGR